MHAARNVVHVGFGLGVMLSLLAATGIASEAAETLDISIIAALATDEEAFSMLRIALASGTAFLIGRMIDIVIFDKLSRSQLAT